MNPKHIRWFNKVVESLLTIDGTNVEVIEILHEPNEEVLSSLASHLRNHYCRDDEIDDMRFSIGLSRADYLRTIKFPDKSISPGPSIRAGDFSEILVADYIEFLLHYIVPRTRYETRVNRNISTSGVDILAFKILDRTNISKNDELLTCEVKAALNSKDSETLAKALSDSKKDFDFRKPEALNAMKQRLKDKNRNSEVRIVERFQDRRDRPYKEISGAAIVHSNHTWSDEVINSASVADHPNSNLFLIAFKGKDLMTLVNGLYERACNEA